MTPRSHLSPTLIISNSSMGDKEPTLHSWAAFSTDTTQCFRRWFISLVISTMLSSCIFGFSLFTWSISLHWGQGASVDDSPQHLLMQVQEKLCPQSKMTGLERYSRQMEQVNSSWSLFLHCSMAVVLTSPHGNLSSALSAFFLVL